MTMESTGIYEEERELQYSDFDMNDQMLYSHMAALFQDVAGNHSQLLGCGYEAMKSKDMIWIIARAKLEMIKQPKVARPLIVKTIAYKPQGLIFDRQFSIVDKETSEILATGITSWCIASLSTRRLVRPQIDTANFEHVESLPYERLMKLPDIDLSDCERETHKVTFVEMDHNRHMNNTHYMDIITNMVKASGDEDITSIEIDYEKECSMSDVLDVFHSKKDRYVVATDSQTGRMIFKARYETSNS